MKLEQSKKRELEDANRKISVLEEEKQRLEEAVVAMKRRASIVPSEQEREVELQNELLSIKEKLTTEKLEAETTAQEHSKLKLDISQFQARLADLRELNERLNVENQNQLEAAKATANELKDVREALETEAQQRTSLEAYVLQLKNEVMGLVAKQMTPSESAPMETPTSSTFPASPFSTFSEISTGALIKKRANLFDMELELLSLRKRLDAEKEESDFLHALVQDLKDAKSAKEDHGGVDDLEFDNGDEKVSRVGGEAGGEYVVPEWIRALNVKATKSKTLRMQIEKQAKENPDALNFR